MNNPHIGSSFDDFLLEEAQLESHQTDLITVIDLTATIENLLDQVIEKYCAPTHDRFTFFRSVVLDSSIMPFGSKVKIAMAIAQELKVKLDQNAIHKVMSLRNAFAHHRTESHPVMVVGKTDAETSSHFELQVINNSGKLSRKRRHEALKEFKASYSTAKLSLLSLLDAIKAS